ncbi:DUF1541 domain-containing protein [Enterococcus termitis]|uniref:DUF1541 domain-containing protein n=1 Tax=Enterococcus termitis TaxID=332950 RepID=A0A1E5GD41_9ENTE|nr:DUF1541 domain-containing protein [Enterococcus termitis]OEG10633.1 hypothetical protein BCR25_09215 [Enterococcus termitis]OJG97896.1 hypothetical protein RV18_GL003910 [Enterococcus termitis]
MITSERNRNKNNQADLKKAQQPKFQIDEQVTVTTGYSPGTQAMTGKIAGSYDTRAYTVTYQPTNGQPLVVNYKWIIQEEIVDSPKEKLTNGKMVLLNADHQIGMEGAKAVIESSISTTVYKIEYPELANETGTHQVWMIEEDLMQPGNE